MLSNLVGNAIEHSDPKSVIDVAARGEDAAVVVTVTNAGPAIPSTALPTLFDPFIRAASMSESNKPHGIGLGLYIARQIVIGHGGTISVASSDSTGTVFTIRLPR